MEVGCSFFRVTRTSPLDPQYPLGALETKQKAKSSGRDPGLELPLAGLGQGWHCEWVRQPTLDDSLRLARHCSQRMKSAAPSPLGSGSFHSSCDASAWGQASEKGTHGWRGTGIRVCVPGSRATASCSQPLHRRGRSAPRPPGAAQLVPRASGRAPRREMGHAGGHPGLFLQKLREGPAQPAGRAGGARACPTALFLIRAELASGPPRPLTPAPRGPLA